MNCQYCKSHCVKNGKQKDGTQKYRCKTCKKYQQLEYKYQAKIRTKRDLVIGMITNNMGFRGIAQSLNMAFNTVQSTILKAAEKCRPPRVHRNGIFEVDEVLAYNKPGVPQIWAAYAINTVTKQVIGINVGRNNKQMLGRTIGAVLATLPKRIYCDGNSCYKALVPETVRRRKCFLKFIERLHLTVRNKLKMMNGKTLAFVRKKETLLACLKLLFWLE